MECEAVERISQACYCPAGFSDYRCSTKDYNKCYVNFTSPALFEGCKDKFEDSEFYVYSIQGYDPCHFYDFSKKYTFEYELKCLAVNDRMQVVEGGHKAGLGFPYADLNKEPEVDLELLESSVQSEENEF